MSRPSLAGAGNHEVRGLARTLVRGVRVLDLRAELDAAHLPWERSGPWDVRLFVLDEYFEPRGTVLFGASAAHWLLAVRARDERARWEHLPALLAVLRVPPGTHPLVAPADTPAGEPLWWFWRPASARVRHAPDKPGRPPLAESVEFVRGAIVRTHDALRALEADRAAARAAAEARARQDVDEAAGAFRVVRLDAPWSGHLHPVPPEADELDTCTACGAPTFDGCGYELAAYTGPARPRRGEPRADGELRLCPSCENDPRKLLEVLYTRAGAGCCLHVVVDDHNLEDESVAFVQGVARERGHTFCARIADQHAAMTLADRRALHGLRPDGSSEDERPVEVLPRPTRPRGGGGALGLLLMLGLLASPDPGADER